MTDTDTQLDMFEGEVCRPRRAHIFKRAGTYIDPAWVSKRLFETENVGRPGDIVLDAGAGKGTILYSARAAGFDAIGVDINRSYAQEVPFPIFHADFLHDPLPFSGSVSSVVVNPPFDAHPVDLIRAFTERALEVAAYKVAILMQVTRLNAARWLKPLPLETVYLLSPRPSMPPAEYIAAGHKPKGGRPDYCWAVFNKFTKREEPRLRWLLRDGGAP